MLLNLSHKSVGTTYVNEFIIKTEDTDVGASTQEKEKLWQWVK